MNKATTHRYTLAAIALLAVIVGIGYYYFFAALSLNTETQYIYIDNDDTIDSVYNKLQPFAREYQMQGFHTLVRHSSYADNIRTGRYAVKAGEGAFRVFRNLKNGMQEPVNLTIPSVRTVDRLAAEVSKHLMLD